MKKLNLVLLLIVLLIPNISHAEPSSFRSRQLDAGRGMLPVPYDFTADFGVGVMSNNETFGVPVVRAATLPANLSGSLCDSTAVAAASTVVLIKLKHTGSGTLTTIATLTFALGANVCTKSTQAAVALVPGDTVIFAGPGTADSTLAGVRIGLKGSSVSY